MKRFVIIALLLCFISAFKQSSYFEQLEPTHFPPTVHPELERVSADKIELGRVLFYDPQFSADGLVSCASCHSPYNAFAHTDHALSHGVFDSVGTRNAPALFNLAWQEHFMHDGASHHLEAQALAPLNSEFEMGGSTADFQQKLTASLLYQDLFAKAFKGHRPNVPDALEALSAFQLSLVSANTKYDAVQAGLQTFTTVEAKGYQVFQTQCASCHKEPLFNGDRFASNGLPVDSLLNDLGRYMITQDSSDRYHFKIPSLRNLRYTYPYMHDGRFLTLREVINHYSPKDGDLRQSPLEKPLSEAEKTELLAFLKTLNDEEFVFNPRHAYPRWVLSYNPKPHD